jgi:molybdenum cofactor guanylyltransferase
MKMVSGLILAGGRSRRMGEDKAFLRIPAGEPGSVSQTFVERLVEKLRLLCVEVVLVAREPMQGCEQSFPDVRVVYDEVADYGPLMGLYSGLRAITSDYALVVAVDMPFVQSELLSFLLAQPLDEAVIMPLVEQTPQVLLAVYPRSVLPFIEECLRAGRRDPRALLEVVAVRYIQEAQLRVVDPQLRSFVNVNTPEEFARYME